MLDPSEVEKNDMTISVLKTVKFMLSHGFYKDTKELMAIALPVMGLLNGGNAKRRKIGNDEGMDPEMEEIYSRMRYFPESHTDPQISSKCIAADILLMISNIESEAKCVVYLAKLKEDIEYAESQ